MNPDQIERYGRQILLREVGGKGQRALLERGVFVEQSNEAISIAAEFLAAAGSPLDLAPGADLSGFLPSSTALAAFNDDVARSAERWLVLGSHVALGPLAFVQVGATGVVFAPERACLECVRVNLVALDGHIDDAPPSVVLGSLAALVAQRLILDLEPEPGHVLIKAGVPSSARFARCSAHR